MDVAVDEYFRDPTQLAARGAAPEQPAASTSKLNTLFDTYKGPLLNLLQDADLGTHIYMFRRF